MKETVWCIHGLRILLQLASVIEVTDSNRSLCAFLFICVMRICTIMNATVKYIQIATVHTIIFSLQFHHLDSSMKRTIREFHNKNNSKFNVHCWWFFYRPSWHEIWSPAERNVLSYKCAVTMESTLQYTVVLRAKTDCFTRSVQSIERKLKTEVSNIQERQKKKYNKQAAFVLSRT